MGFQNFEKMMANYSASYVIPLVQKSRGTKVNPKDHEVFRSIFYGFTEISSTIETLKLVGTLIKTSPPRSKKINADEYIKFLVGGYLQEVYILEQRLSAYAKKISRLYKSSIPKPVIEKIVYNPIKTILDFRGDHVHTERYSDKHLDMVSTMALFKRVGDELGCHLGLFYKAAQKEWVEMIAEFSLTINSILENYFDLLERIVAPDGILVPPVTVNKI